MVRRVRAAGGRARACLWYQGESDAAMPDGAHYRRNMGSFIKAVRRDLKLPDLPFLQVQLACFFGDAAVFPHWNRVQTDQIALEADLPGVATAAAVDLDLSDAIHVSTAGMRKLGARLAHLAEMLVYGNTSRQIGPRFVAATVAPDRLSAEVSFASVNGRLRASAPILGFTVTAGDRPVAIPSRKLVGPATVRLAFREPLPKRAVLWYGAGWNPPVSLWDSAGLAVPVFGPVKL
jgi:sialate O-acetylesterase